MNERYVVPLDKITTVRMRPNTEPRRSYTPVMELEWEGRSAFGKLMAECSRKIQGRSPLGRAFKAMTQQDWDRVGNEILGSMGR